MKRKSAQAEVAAETGWVGATVIDEKPSATSRILVFLLCAAVVASTLAYGMVDAWALACFCLFAGAVALVWIADALKTGQLRYSSSWLPLPLLGLILIGAIQLLPLRNTDLPQDLLAQTVNNSFSFDSFATKLAVAQLTAMLVFFFAALTFINNQKRLQTATATVIIFGFVLAIYSMIQFFSSEGKIYWLREPVQAVPFGPFINRHHFAACMMMIAGLTLGLLYTKAVESQKRALHLFAVVVMGIGILFTGSRGAVLSFVAVVIFLIVAGVASGKNQLPDADEDDDARQPFARRLLVLGAGLTLVAVVFAAVLLLDGDNLLLRSVGVASLTQADASSGRLEFWQNTMRIVSDNWLLGVGLDAFGVAYTRFDTSNGYYRLERAHNDYLQILAEGGIIGLGFVVAFVLLLFRNGWRILTTTRDRFRRGVCLGALAGCAGVLVHSFFDFPLRTPSNLVLFLMLAALATVSISHPKLYRRRRSSKSSRNAEQAV